MSIIIITYEMYFCEEAIIASTDTMGFHLKIFRFNLQLEHSNHVGNFLFANNIILFAMYGSLYGLSPYQTSHT
jgi:hypothetical protein